MLLTKYIPISPLFLAGTLPRYSHLKSDFLNSKAGSEILIFPGSPLLSILEAVFTVSPQISQANFSSPTTPAVIGSI